MARALGTQGEACSYGGHERGIRVRPCPEFAARRQHRNYLNASPSPTVAFPTGQQLNYPICAIVDEIGKV
jgi:hypothetical protein